MTNIRYAPAARLLACLLAGLLLMGLGAVPGVHAHAEVYDPIDLEKPCSLMVYPSGSTEFQEDLADAVLKLDVYQVAAAAPVPGVNTYDYTLGAAFTSLESLLAAAREPKTDTAEKSAAEQSREAWAELAQKAAGIIQTGTSGAAPTTIVKAEGETTLAVPNLGAGLYLLIARSDDADYWEGSAEEGDLTSVAHSDGYNYLFAPQLVSLPFKSSVMEEPGEDDAPVMTSDDAGWVYAVTLYLKPERQPRKADLVIKKTLQNYKVKSDALFIFHVDAFDEKGVNIYSKAYSIVLSKDGTAYTLAKDIPVGATVTVKEYYTGASCKSVGPTEYEGIMTSEGLDTGSEVLFVVPFVNEGKGHNGGGGIENTFEYTPSATDPDSGYWKFINQNLDPGSPDLPETES